MNSTDRMYAGMAEAVDAAYKAQADYEAGTSSLERFDTEQARTKALRRLSGALGRHVTDDEIDWSSSIDDTLIGKAGGGWSLLPSNAVYVVDGSGRYMRNGAPMDSVEVERLYAR
jgi:hypothetical protein